MHVLEGSGGKIYLRTHDARFIRYPQHGERKMFDLFARCNGMYDEIQSFSLKQRLVVDTEVEQGVTII